MGQTQSRRVKYASSFFCSFRVMFNTQEIAVSEFRHFKEVLDGEGVKAALAWAEDRLHDIERAPVSAEEKRKRIGALRVIVDQY